MQTSKAQRLRELYRGKNCDHPGIEKEYYLSAHTGDYVCSTCGYEFISREEWEKYRANLSINKTDDSE